MRRGLVAALAVLLAGASPAAADPVDVTVVEVAGGRAYLEPGEEAGLAPGSVVAIGGRRFTILAVTRRHAVVDLAGAALAEGAKGTGQTAGRPAAAEKLAAPQVLGRWAGQWPPPSWPADRQVPRRVPLGPARAGGDLRLAVVGQVLAIRGLETGTTEGHAELGARASFEPWRERPFGVDADASARLWFQEPSGLVARGPAAVLVRELRLRYGAEADPLVALGRLPWAAHTMGVLDGARLRTPAFGGFSAAAFGGLVPDVLTGAASSETGRFGAELTWAAPTAAQPRLALVAHGSIFEGAIDERRLAAVLDASPGPFLLGARAELALFDAGNPWGLSTLQLVSAGADVQVREGAWSAGAHVDLRQPERSRYLASVLPQTWLCTPTPGPPGVAEPCDGSPGYRTAAAADAGWASARLALALGASLIVDDDGLSESSVFAGARILRLLGRGRLGLGASAARGTYLDQLALRVEAGAALAGDRIDLTLSWRGALLSYVAALRDLLENRVGLDAGLALGPTLGTIITVEGTFGADVTSLIGLVTLVWRPLP